MKFYFTGKKVIATSRDAGKTIKGIAKCSPEDEFDVEKGKELAAARCNVKVTERRKKRAATEYDEIVTLINELERYKEKKSNIYTKAANEAYQARVSLQKLLEEL